MQVQAQLKFDDRKQLVSLQAPAMTVPRERVLSVRRPPSTRYRQERKNPTLSMTAELRAFVPDDSS
jgi:hypothetical protein